jgi:predicted NUDIX family phosphoesterase
MVCAAHDDEARLQGAKSAGRGGHLHDAEDLASRRDLALHFLDHTGIASSNQHQDVLQVPADFVAD